jgi:hypothetical protein
MPTTPTENRLKKLELLSFGFFECFICDHTLPKPQATGALFSLTIEDVEKRKSRGGYRKI